MDGADRSKFKSRIPTTSMPGPSQPELEVQQPELDDHNSHPTASNVTQSHLHRSEPSVVDARTPASRTSAVAQSQLHHSAPSVVDARTPASRTSAVAQSQLHHSAPSVVHARTPASRTSAVAQSQLHHSAPSVVHAGTPPSFPTAGHHYPSVASPNPPMLLIPAQSPFTPPPQIAGSSAYRPYSPSFYTPTSYYKGADASHTNVSQPFYLMFVKGNISRCAGCGLKNLRQIDGSPFPPPEDLCVQHKEYVLFENPKTGIYQLSNDLRNVYYHARCSCVTTKNPCFNPSNLKVTSDVQLRLTMLHRKYIAEEFGVI